MGVFGADEEEGQTSDLTRLVEHLLGEKRFGGVWTDGPFVCVAVVELTASDIDAVQSLIGGSNSAVRFCSVRYSRAELIQFYADFDSSASSALASIGCDASQNRVRATLNRLDASTVRFLHGRIPRDALSIEVVPGVQESAATNIVQ
jgi:hypothetical protein